MYVSCIFPIVGFRIEAPNKDLRLHLDYLGQHIYLKGLRCRHTEGFFTNSDWPETHLLNPGKKISREFSIQALEYLISMSPDQICYPEALFEQDSMFANENRVKLDIVEQSAKKKYATDQSQINRAEEPLAPAMMAYLKSIASRDDDVDDEDHGNIYLYIISKLSMIALFQHTPSILMIGSEDSIDDDNVFTSSQKKVGNSVANSVSKKSTSFENAQATNVNPFKRKMSGNKIKKRSCSSILTRLTNANPNLKWKFTDSEKCSINYIN